jgi:quercetin dioxygenase-like cupin family protein
MALSVVDVEELTWSSVDDSWAGRAADGEPGVRFKPFAVGADSVPSGQLVEYAPGHFEGAHSHEEDELLYLLEGRLTIEERELGPGTLIHVEGGTVYGPLRSAQGCRFLRLHLSKARPEPD